MDPAGVVAAIGAPWHRFTDWFEEQWLDLHTTYNDVWINAFGTFFIHTTFYFGFHLQYLVADMFPSVFGRWKIQQKKVNTAERQLYCFKHLLFLHCLIELPMMAASHPFFGLTGMVWQAPLPSWSEVLFQIVCFFVIEDFYFYWIHRLLHVPWMYQNVHKMHHHHSAPFGMAAEFAHPVETLFLGIGSVLGPLLMCHHRLTLWLWLIVRLYQTIEAHCGYDFPWGLHRFIPFWGGAEFHDFHHKAFVGNYASTFVIWDYVFGTDLAYHKAKTRQYDREDAPPASDSRVCAAELACKAVRPAHVEGPAGA